MAEVLEQLREGVRTFQKETYPAMEGMYRESVQKPQAPHTLMITCSDSRIDIESVTHARPGELFVTRNVGNLVPRYGETVSGVAAVVEYAVNALKVRHIVVCGHADCGAMKALQNPAALDKLPMVKNWLGNADDSVWAWERGRKHDAEPLHSLAELTEKNVLAQLEHLKSHPAVAAATDRGELTLSGWVYEIGTGDVRIAKYGETTFTPVSKEPAA